MLRNLQDKRRGGTKNSVPALQASFGKPVARAAALDSEQRTSLNSLQGYRSLVVMSSSGSSVNMLCDHRLCCVCLRLDLESARYLGCRPSDHEVNLRNTGLRALWWKVTDRLRAALTRVWRLSPDEQHAFTVKKEALRRFQGRTERPLHEAAPSVRRNRLITQRRTAKHINKPGTLLTFARPN